MERFELYGRRRTSREASARWRIVGHLFIQRSKYWTTVWTLVCWSITSETHTLYALFSLSSSGSLHGSSLRLRAYQPRSESLIRLISASPNKSSMSSATVSGGFRSSGTFLDRSPAAFRRLIRLLRWSLGESFPEKGTGGNLKLLWERKRVVVGLKWKVPISNVASIEWRSFPGTVEKLETKIDQTESVTWKSSHRPKPKHRTAGLSSVQANQKDQNR